VKDEKEKDKLKWRRKKEIRKISKYIVVWIRKRSRPVVQADHAFNVVLYWWNHFQLPSVPVILVTLSKINCSVR
jgi:hypothetical protein